MPSRKDTIQRTLIVATLLCIVCSVLVSTSAVFLRPLKTENKRRDRNRNILSAAGLFKEGDDPATIPEIFRTRVEAKVVELATGEYADGIDPASFDERKEARDPARNVAVPAAKDIASIKHRSKRAVVYLVRKDGELRQVVLPVHGMGLWSTLYGFLALDRNTTTVRGLTFYEHGETPGLGGEVDNKRWKAQWVGKQAFGETGSPRIEVLKGLVDTSREEARYQVDGLAGATITSRGVTNLVRFWLGDDGFGAFLKKLRAKSN